MIVVDTSAWIDYVNGLDAPHTRLIDVELEKNRIITGDIIITEFLQGFKSDHDFIKAKHMMDLLDYHDFLGKELAIKAAQNFRTLRKNGITIRKMVDVIIATFCIENNFELIHNDKDFDYISATLGLRILHES